MARKTYEQRLQETSNPLLKKLFRIIIDKKSNLCVAVNFKSIDEILKFVDKAGQHICILKTQLERVRDSSVAESLRLLYEKKKKYNFLLFEDRKFCDGGETIEDIYSTYVQYVDIVTVMPICGDGIFRSIDSAVKKANLPEDEPRGCFAVCQVSFEDWILDEAECLKVATRNSNICAGIIAQTLQVEDDSAMIKATPGVHISQKRDGMNQQWNHPAQVVGYGSDIVIVGRGIVAAPEDELEATTRLYKEVSFKAYCDSV